MQDLIRINVGCGQSPTPGWKNFDNSPSLRMSRLNWLPPLLFRLGLIQKTQKAFMQCARTHAIEYADASRRLPLPDHSVDVVYSSHMLEHLDSESASRFLHETRRVLHSGGVIRLVVPDIRTLAQDYLVHGDANAFLGKTLLCQPHARSFAQRLQFLITGPRHHQWMYDGTSLCNLLAQHGFAKPAVMAAGQTRIHDAQGLDLSERAEESVYVEAETP